MADDRPLSHSTEDRQALQHVFWCISSRPSRYAGEGEGRSAPHSFLAPFAKLQRTPELMIRGLHPHGKRLPCAPNVRPVPQQHEPRQHETYQRRSGAPLVPASRLNRNKIWRTDSSITPASQGVSCYCHAARRRTTALRACGLLLRLGEGRE